MFNVARLLKRPSPNFKLVCLKEALLNAYARPRPVRYFKADGKGLITYGKSVDECDLVRYTRLTEALYK